MCVVAGLAADDTSALGAGMSHRTPCAFRALHPVACLTLYRQPGPAILRRRCYPKRADGLVFWYAIAQPGTNLRLQCSFRTFFQGLRF